jgi:hypothetical protein
MRTAKKKKAPRPARSTSRTSKKKKTAAPVSPAIFAPEVVQKFVNDIRIRGESGRLKKGKLAQGLTHIENKKGSSTELTRARYNLTG